MEEQVDPTFYNTPRTDQEQRCRDLIASIIFQAVHDATSNNKELRKAIFFIDDNNQLFGFYCELLGLEPTCVASKLRALIKEKITYV